MCFVFVITSLIIHTILLVLYILLSLPRSCSLFTIVCNLLCARSFPFTHHFWIMDFEFFTWECKPMSEQSYQIQIQQLLHRLLFGSHSRGIWGKSQFFHPGCYTQIVQLNLVNSNMFYLPSHGLFDLLELFSCGWHRC